MDCDKPVLNSTFPFISRDEYRVSPRFPRECVAPNAVHVPPLTTFCSYRQSVHATDTLPVVRPRAPRSCSSPTRWSRCQRPPAPRAQTTRTPHHPTIAKAWTALPVVALEVLLPHQPSEDYPFPAGLASLRLRLSLPRMTAPPAMASAPVISQVEGCLVRKTRDYPRPSLERPQLSLARKLVVAVAQSSTAGRTLWQATPAAATRAAASPGKAFQGGVKTKEGRPAPMMRVMERGMRSNRHRSIAPSSHPEGSTRAWHSVALKTSPGVPEPSSG